MRQVDTKKLFTVSVLALLFLSLFGGLGVWQIKPAYATEIFRDDFENAHTTWSGTYGTPTINTTATHHGANASQAVSVAWDDVGAYEDFSSMTTLYAREYVRFSTIATYEMCMYVRAQYATLVYFGLASTTQWRIRGSDDGVTYNYDSVSGDTIVADHWYCVECKVVYSDTVGEYRWYVDGIEVITETGLNTTIDNGGDGLHQVFVGAMDLSGGAWTDIVDCVVISSSYIGIEVPTITVGSNIDTNSTTAGEPCLFYTDWTTLLSNLSTYIRGTNNTGTWINDTAVAFPEGLTYGFSNFTEILNETDGVRVEWEIWANNTEGNWTNNGLQFVLTTVAHLIFATDFEDADGWDTGPHGQRLLMNGGSDYGIDNFFVFSHETYGNGTAWIEGLENNTLPVGVYPHSGSRCIGLDTPNGSRTESPRVEFNIAHINDLIGSSNQFYVSEWIYLNGSFSYKNVVDEWGSLGCATMVEQDPWRPYTAFLLERTYVGEYRMYMGYRDVDNDMNQLGTVEPYTLTTGAWFHREFYVYCGTDDNEDGFVTYWIDGEMQFNVSGVQVRRSGYDFFTTIAKLYYSETDTAGNRMWVDDFELWDAIPCSVSITNPTNVTYTVSIVPVQLSASGGTIDTILWNCTYANGTVAYANTVYTVATSMTLGSSNYIFNAWANNTDGDSGEATVEFSVQIPVVIILIISPTNSTYSSSSVPVNFDATGGFPIDKKWFNIKNDTTWVYTSNQTYTVPTSITGFVNGTNYTFYAYANNTYGTLGVSTVMFTIQIPPQPDHYYFGWSFRDLDSNDVETKITWQLYNSTQLLTYTEGQATLLAGTYTLKTYYHTSLIDQTVLSTAADGNTTVTIYLEMKAYAYGYLAFSNTVTSLDLNSQSMYNLTFTISGSVPTTMTIDFPYSPTYISKAGANQTGWTYTGGYVTLTTSSLSVWSLIYEPGAPPLPAPSEVTNFLAFLLAGDFLGFIMAVYTQGFGSADVFFGVVIMLIMVPLYIRTKSLMFMSILWILLGSLFLVAMPLVSGLAVLLLVLGIGSMLFELFMFNRRG